MKEKFRIIDVVLVILMVVSMIMNCITCIFVYRDRSRISVLEAANGSIVDNEISVDIKETKITGSKKTEILSDIANKFDSLINSNTYVTCPIVSDDESTEDEVYYETFIYNKNGEVIVDNDYTNEVEVIMPDARSLVFSEDGYYDTYDSDVLREVYAAAMIAQSNNANLYEVELSDYAENTVRYDIDINGYVNIKKLFDVIAIGLGDTIVDYYKNVITAENGFVESQEASMKYSIVLYNDNVESVVNYIYEGAKQQTDTNKLFAVWAFNGYTEVYDWELQDDWYEIDYTTLHSEDEELVSEQWKKLDELLVELHSSVIEMLEKVQKDTNIEAENTDTETENTDTETEDTDN